MAEAMDPDGARTGRTSLLEPESGSLQGFLALLHNEIFLRPAEKQQRHRAGWECSCLDGACFPRTLPKALGTLLDSTDTVETMCQLIQESLGFWVRSDHAQGGQWMTRGATSRVHRP